MSLTFSSWDRIFCGIEFALTGNKSKFEESLEARDKLDEAF